MNNLKRYLKNDYSIVFVFDVIAKILTAITTVIIIRMLSVKDYANYTVFLSISTLIFSIIGSGISMAYVRYAAEFVSRGFKQSNKLLNDCYIFIAVMTVVFTAFSVLLSRWYEVPLIISFCAVAYGGLLSLNKIAQSFFQAENQYKKSGIITNIKNVSFFVVVLLAFLVVRQASDMIVITLMMFCAVLAFAISVRIIKQFNAKNNKEERIISLKGLLKEGGLCIVYSFFVALFDQSNVLILAKVGTSQDIACFGVATKYYALVLMFLTSLLTVLRVKVSDSKYVEDSKERRRFIINWIHRIWLISLAVCLVCALGAQFVFPIINGSDYNQAIVIFQVLMIGVFISYTFAPSSALMLAAERYYFLCLNSLISLIVGCAICYWGVQTVGIWAAGLSVVVSNAIFNVANTIAILRGW